AFPCVAWSVELLCCARRDADGTRPGRAAPDLGAASPRPCNASGGASCLGIDVVLPGRGSRCTDTLCTGDSPIRSPAVPCLCIALWGRRWCGVSQLCCLDAVVSRLS